MRLASRQTFLGLMTLETGAELVSLALLLNKVIGLYGILAILTGYSMSALQVSKYIYSLLVLGALAYLIRHIRKQSPVQNLALAYVYSLDTLVNAAYTITFAVNWYNSTFHDPKGTAGAESGPTDTEAETSEPGDYVAQSGVADAPVSIVLVIVFGLLRVYFSLVVMSYARLVLQHAMDTTPALSEQALKGSSMNPFGNGSALSQGWKGQLGRALVAVAPGFWLSYTPEEEEWARAVRARFQRSAARSGRPPVAGPSGQ